MSAEFDRLCRIMKTLDARAVAADLPGWEASADGRAITRTYNFRDFDAAFAWMTRVAAVAARTDHHPNWRNVYRRVEVALTSHDAGGVTARDVSLARSMDRLWSDYLA